MKDKFFFVVNFVSIFIAIVGVSGLFMPLGNMIAGQRLSPPDMQFVVLFSLILGFGVYMNLYVRNDRESKE